MIIALSMIRTFWMSIDDVRIFMTYIISNDVSVCSVDDFKKSKNYHMYNIVLKLIMTLWLRMMFETMRKRKIHHKQNERFQTLQHLENVLKISWSNIEHENSILTLQSCDCWMIEIRSWEDRKSFLKSCDRVDRVCLKRLKSKKKCRDDRHCEKIHWRWFKYQFDFDKNKKIQNKCDKREKINSKTKNVREEKR